MKRILYTLLAIAAICGGQASADGIVNSGSSITISGKSVAPGGTYAPARSTVSGASPGAGAAGAVVMGGLALSITPITSGNVSFSGVVTASNSSAAGCQAQIAYGTGAAPAHNATSTGTAVGAVSTATNTAAANSAIPVIGYATGLTVNTAYWADVQYTQNGGGTCTIQAFTIQGLEQ